MATTTAPLTPHTDQTPAVAEVSKELSGAQWCSRFPGSASLDALEGAFKTNASNFIHAITDAGGSVIISATYRPPERAYLMHWCYRIAKKGQDPGTVPARDGVNIEWSHGTKPASVQAAVEMVNGYSMENLDTIPALDSRHTHRAAMDISISWAGTLKIKNKDGTTAEIVSTPRSGMNADLAVVGATYGVTKYDRRGVDRPHWSDDGS